MSDPITLAPDPVRLASLGHAAQAQFRGGMRQLAGGVCIVSTSHAGAQTGLTVTSATSLSADPPLLLVCINRTFSGFDAFAQAKSLCLNVLAASQSPIADCFAGRYSLAPHAKFQAGEWTTHAEEVPVLKGCNANFICSIESCIDVGTHRGFVCLVKDVWIQGDQAPLVYFDGRYCAPSAVMGTPVNLWG